MKTNTVFGKPRTKEGVTYWNGEESNQKVGRTVIRNDAQLTKFQFIRKGGFFDQMPIKASADLVPLKVGMDTIKYGGYNRPSSSFFMLVKFNIKKSKEVMVVPVDSMIGDRIINDESLAKAYIAAQIESIINKSPSNIEFPLGLNPLRINTVFALDGFKTALTGKDSGGTRISMCQLEPLRLSNADSYYVKKLEALVEKATSNPKYIYNYEFDVVNEEYNSILFNTIEKKISTIYSQRPESPHERIAWQKQKFDS